MFSIRATLDTVAVEGTNFKGGKVKVWRTYMRDRRSVIRIVVATVVGPILAKVRRRCRTLLHNKDEYAWLCNADWVSPVRGKRPLNNSKISSRLFIFIFILVTIYRRSLSKEWCHWPTGPENAAPKAYCACASGSNIVLLMLDEAVLELALSLQEWIPIPVSFLFLVQLGTHHSNELFSNSNRNSIDTRCAQFRRCFACFREKGWHFKEDPFSNIHFLKELLYWPDWGTWSFPIS